METNEESPENALTRLHRTGDVFTKVYNAKNTIYTDHMGAFLNTSRAGNKYIINNGGDRLKCCFSDASEKQKKQAMIIAYKNLLKQITQAGLKPKNILELVPSDSHRCIIAEVAIKTFQKHFISILTELPEILQCIILTKCYHW